MLFSRSEFRSKMERMQRIKYRFVLPLLQYLAYDGLTAICLMARQEDNYVSKDDCSPDHSQQFHHGDIVFGTAGLC